MLTDHRLHELADQLLAVAGIEAVMLGGSRSRGAEAPDSDVDLGLYYRPPLDVAALRRLAASIATSRPDQGPLPEVTDPGGWGPWVDGGGWLTIEDMPVDWIYRDLERVQRSWTMAQAGEFDVHFQVGHPLGFPDFAYAGEVALGVVLADSTGELTALHREAAVYPGPLADTIVERLGEARFVLGALIKSAKRGDTTLVAGSLFRVIGLCAHAVHARNRTWVITEKGLVDAAGRLPSAPPAFAQRAHGILAHLGSTPAELLAAISAAEDLVNEVAARPR